MAHKYKTGDYIVIFFDRYGTKKGSAPAANWSEGVEKGKEMTIDGGSFVVTRTVYNSLDGHATAVRDFEEGEQE